MGTLLFGVYFPNENKPPHCFNIYAFTKIWICHSSVTSAEVCFREGYFFPSRFVPEISARFTLLDL